MNRRLRPRAWLLGAVAGVALAAGCVERKYVITTDPPGALVLVDGEPLSPSAADGTFVYYGKRRFTLIKDGYQTQHVEQDVPAPWYEYPPIDFISENLIPWTIQDTRRFHYLLEPQQMPNIQQVGDRAQQLRERGRAIGAPLQPPDGQ